MVEFRVSDISDLERLSISDLMTYMKTEFRSGYLKEVENIVYLRVERLKLEKEEEVRVYKDKCSELSNVNVKLEFTKVDLEAEVKDYKLKCEELKEEVTRLEEDCRVVGGREKRALERISSLLSEIEKGNADKKEVIELKANNRELECSKKRAEDELEAYKKRYMELETRVTKLENDTLYLESQVLVNDLELEAGAEGSNRKPKKDKVEQSKVQTESNGGMPNLKIRGSTLRGTARVLDFSGVDSACHTPVKGSGSGQVEGSPVVNLLCNPLANHKEGIETPSSAKLGIGRSGSQNVIEIIDSDNDSETTSKEDPNNSVLRTCSSQKGEDGSSSREKHPSLSALKKKRRRLILGEDSEDDDEHKIQNIKRMGSEVHHQSCLSPTVSYRGEKSRISEQTPFKPFEMTETSCKKSRNLIAANAVKKVGNDGEGKNLGAFHLIGSDRVDREANSFTPEKTNDSTSKLISSIRRGRSLAFKWQYEIDMIYSFEADPVLCMRAVCALYRQHMSEQKAASDTLHFNGRGFSKFGEKRGTALAQFLLEGSQEGEIKKSVKDLEIYDPTGLDECKRLAKYYSKQLFTMFKNKEDPFFP